MPSSNHGRYSYRPITDRPDYLWPNGRRLAVYIALNLEHFTFRDGRADERAVIAEAPGSMWREEGHAPTGWLGPWISESRYTPDLLKEAGYRYLLDWCCDDQPLWFNTRSGQILSIPYPQEINDIPAIVARHPSTREFPSIITHNS